MLTYRSPMASTKQTSDNQELPENPETREEINQLLKNIEEGSILEVRDPRKASPKTMRVGKIEKIRDSDGKVWRKLNGKTWTGSRNGKIVKPQMGMNPEWASVTVKERGDL